MDWLSAIGEHVVSCAVRESQGGAMRIACAIGVSFATNLYSGLLTAQGLSSKYDSLGGEDES